MRNRKHWAALCAISFRGFRIADEAIDRDAKILETMGVKMVFNTEVADVNELKAQGFEKVVLAVGALTRNIETGSGETMNALEFLAQFKALDGNVDIGKNVVVIGGGNTAMDTARAAKRTNGVENVSLVYRRTKRYMPADAEELEMAVEDGVEFCELLAPVRLEAGKLVCKVMKLGDLDASGRRGVVETGEFAEVDADTVIVAVGEKVPTAFYKANGLHVSERGKALVNEETLESNVAGVYVVGDGLGGPATVVEGIRDGKMAAEAIIGECLAKDFDQTADEETIYNRRGISVRKQTEKTRVQDVSDAPPLCQNRTEVCPNRANVAIRVPGMENTRSSMSIICVTSAATVRASARIQARRIWTNLHCLQMKQILQTVKTRDLQFLTGMCLHVKYGTSERNSSGRKGRKPGLQRDCRN